MIQQYESGMSKRYVFDNTLNTTLKHSQNKKGMTHKLLKGHTKWVFCLNYNTASNLLVSGGCDGDVRIWNAARGWFPCLFVDIRLLATGGRKVHANLTRSYGLCHGGSLQQRRLAYSLLCPGRSHVRIDFFSPSSPIHAGHLAEYGTRVMGNVSKL